MQIHFVSHHLLYIFQIQHPIYALGCHHTQQIVFLCHPEKQHRNNISQTHFKHIWFRDITNRLI